MATRRSVQLVWRTAVILLVAGALGWWVLSWNPVRRHRSEPDKAPAVESNTTHAWAPREQRPPAPGCSPRASTKCIDGDVWWVDSCGELNQIAHDCGPRRCVGGECENDTGGGCGEVTALGQCDGDVARICQVGRIVEIDCAAKERRCITTSDGPMCREKSPDDCTSIGATRCEGQSLLTCADGRWATIDCRSLGGMCAPGRGGGPSRCLFAAPADEECGACGCPPAPTDEICDGQDNDGDGSIDEDVDCGPVPIAAFVIVDKDGQGSYTDDDVKAAIDQLNGWFVRDDGFGLVFELGSIVRIAEPEWLELDMKEVNLMLDRGMIAVTSDEFQAPVVFTDVVLAEEVPRPGLSTVPNGMCGGERRIWDRQPSIGVVALAKRRWGSTLAHEMGHFLGLCHTHEAPPAIRQVAASAETPLADAQPCDEQCIDDPDGLCDTPLDPGPQACGIDAECAIHCESGDRPDPENIMAYYPECRSLFSLEQALLMRHSLALRRGWHRCLGADGCVCNPSIQDCPEQMTCRAYVGGAGTDWRCDLDGPAMPGGVCVDGSECGHGSICVHTPEGEGRCARTCDPAAGRCKCEPITRPEVAVCREDLRIDEG